MQQIALLNPMTGQYEFFDDKTSAATRFSHLLKEFYLLHTNQQPFSFMQINDDGSKTWKTINGTDITSIINEFQITEDDNTMN